LRNSTRADGASRFLESHLDDAATALVESRRDARVAVCIGAQIFSADFRGGVSARTRDLSLGGACLATRSPLAVQSLRRVVLELPEGGAVELPVEGRWQSTPHGDDSVLTGICFVDHERVWYDRIWKVIETAAQDLARFVAHESDLRGIGSDDAVTIAHASRYRFAKRGQMIHRQDEPSASDDSIYLLRSGEVAIAVCSPRRELATRTERPGALFGGLSIVAGVPSLDCAAALADSSLIEVSAAAFAYLSVAKPLSAQRLARAVVGAHARRWRDLIRGPIAGAAGD
jgi:hypothetical protein